MKPAIAASSSPPASPASCLLTPVSYRTHTTPASRHPSIVDVSKPSSARIASVWAPKAGTGPMTGSTPSIVAGGADARTDPAGVSTSCQRPRATSCGWSANCRTVRNLAFAMRADSNRSRQSNRKLLPPRKELHRRLLRTLLGSLP